MPIEEELRSIVRKREWEFWVSMTSPLCERCGQPKQEGLCETPKCWSLREEQREAYQQAWKCLAAAAEDFWKVDTNLILPASVDIGYLASNLLRWWWVNLRVQQMEAPRLGRSAGHIAGEEHLKPNRRERGPMKLSYGVVTECPEGDGNLADTFLTTDGKTLFAGVYNDNLAFVTAPEVKTPVFTLGELLILNEYGREISGQGRKPSKWWIGFEVFLDLQAACQRAVQVTEAANAGSPIPPALVKPHYVQTVQDAQKRSEAMVEAIRNMPMEELNKLPIVQQLRKALEGLGVDNGHKD